LHGCLLALHALVHACRVASQAKPPGQSACVLQPHAPAMHTAPALPPHATHAPPDEPQIALAVPGAQLPALQQPPLHGWVTEQLVVHTCAPTSHERPGAQSVATLQPQLPPMHAWPKLALEQSTHALPTGPQAVAAVPGWQPPLWQQPFVHGDEPEQAPRMHTCVLALQVPLEQSALVLQPQVPARHALPLVPAVQLAHAPPLTPHAVGAAPPTQVPDEQQPPLHG
jgi:hypothetical protein